MVLAVIVGVQRSPCAGPAGNPRAPLRTAASILALTSEQAKHGYPAKLQGVVTAPGGIGFIIQDSTAGIWVNLPNADQFALGDLLVVQGTVAPGGYSPEVNARFVRKIGHRALPRAKEVTFRELSSGNDDAQYVSVVGTVRSVLLPEAGMVYPQIWVRLAMNGGFVDATLPGSESNSAPQLLDSEVRINAVAFCAKNRSRQLTSVVLSIANLDQIKVLRAPQIDPFAIPLTSLNAVMQFRSGTDYFHRVRVAGVVTYYDPGKRLILEDGEQAILVDSPPGASIKIGDHVEVSGFPAPDNSGPFLQDSILRIISHGEASLPVRTQISDMISGAFRYRLVSVEGHIVRRIEEPWGIELLVQGDADLLQAELNEPVGSSDFRTLKEGTKVRITGINLVDVEGKWNYAQSWIHCKLLLRSSDDVKVLQLPSWWTTRRVTYLVSVLSSLIVILLGLVIYNQIARWKLQVVFKERERMALEVHDTMSQSFAGIGFQLQAILRAVPGGMNDLQQEVAHALDLVRHSHKEARRSFAPIEADVHQEIDILHSLESCARQMAASGTIAISVSTTGVPCTLSPNVANQLLRIGQEAIANAIRHAEPRYLSIVVEYAPESIKIELQDDGIGFVKSGTLLGFGLRGMRKRAAEISAKLEIDSELGRGTRIEVIAPLKSTPKWTSWIKQIWNRGRRQRAA